MRSPVQSRLPLPGKSESYEVRGSLISFRVLAPTSTTHPLKWVI